MKHRPSNQLENYQAMTKEQLVKECIRLKLKNAKQLAVIQRLQSRLAEVGGLHEQTENLSQSIR